MVKVTLEDINKVVFFTSTPEWADETEAWRKAKCSDHETFWCRLVTSNGGVQIRRQCRVCGYLLGGPRKREPGDESLPAYDPEMARRYYAERELQRLQILQKHARLQYDKSNNWFRDYDDYLKSDEWRARRILVLKRSGGVCEGCGLAEATQVHHLTYRHAKREFLFELVAVCEDCHSRLHEDEETAENSGADAALDSSNESDLDWIEHPCNGCRFTSDERGEFRCFVLDEAVAVALAPNGGCGPERRLFEELR